MVAMLQQGQGQAMVLNSDVVTIKDASAQTGYSAEYLRRLIRAGEIEASKLGTVYLVKLDSLLDYVRERAEDGKDSTGPRGKAARVD